MARRRLDAELVRRGLVASRRDATAAIEARRVLVSGSVAEKATRLVDPGEPVRVLGDAPRFVSRGGDKLDHALDAFGLDVRGVRAIDAGASTGGFTDCLLQRGAATVVAVDVGHGQLHPKLRDDPRVMVLERVNVRTLTPDTVGGPAELVVADLSFISLAKVLPALVECTLAGGALVLLVKPQFEAGRAEVARGRGVITDPEIHARVRAQVEEALVAAGTVVVAWTDSPITGAEGNREFFVQASRPERTTHG